MPKDKVWTPYVLSESASNKWMHRTQPRCQTSSQENYMQKHYLNYDKRNKISCCKIRSNRNRKAKYKCIPIGHIRFLPDMPNNLYYLHKLQKIDIPTTQPGRLRPAEVNSSEVRFY